MTHHRLTVTWAAGLSLLVAGAPVGAPAGPQDRPRQGPRESSPSGAFLGWGELLEGSYVFDPDEEQVDNYKVATSPEVRFLVGEARRLIDAGAYGEAVRHLQRVLDEFPNHLYPVSRAQYLGAGELARYLLSRMPAAGRAAYQDFVVRRAAPLLEAARRAPEVARLEEVATQFEFAAEGRDALVSLAELSFERGEFERAEAFILRLLPTLDAADPLRAMLVGRLALSHRLQGQSLRRLGSLVEEGTRLLLAGAECDVGELLREPSDGAGASDFVERNWPIFGGGNDRNRIARAPALLPDLGVEAYSLPIFDALPDGIDPFEKAQAEGRRERIPPYQPIRLGDTLLLNNSISVWAANLYSGEKIWTYPGPFLGTGMGRYTTLRQYTEIQPCPFSNNYLASLTAAGGIVLANVLRPEPWERPHRLDSHWINAPLPMRSLVALRSSDGKELWRHDRVGGSELMERLSIPSPPVVVGDLVVAFGYYREGGINAFLVMLDLETGMLRRETPLCISQSELTMFGRPFREFTAAPVSAGDAIYTNTNLGLLACIDITTGWVRWMSEYPIIRIRPATHFPRPNPRPVYWANNPVIVDGDAVYIAPHDSDYLLCYDRFTGTKRWMVSAVRTLPGELRYLLGVNDGRVLVTGNRNVVAFDARDGRLLWRRPLDMAQSQTPVGRGVLTGDQVFVPVAGELLRFSQEDGEVLGASPWKRQALRSLDHYPGNLLVFPDLLVTVGSRELSVYIDIHRALGEVERRLQHSKETFTDLLVAANLLRYQRDHARALEYYERALARAQRENAPPQATAEARLGIHRSCLERCRALARVDPPGAFAMLERARSLAPSKEADLQACVSLLPDLALTRDAGKLAALVEDLDRRWGSELLNVEGLAKVPVGLHVGMQLADFYAGLGRISDEVGTLHRVAARFGDSTWDGKTVRDLCFGRIDERVRQHGRSIYAELDRQAQQLVERARKNKDADALLYAVQTFPNADVVGSAIVGLGELLLERGRLADLFGHLPAFVRDHPRAKQVGDVLWLMARAAGRAGNTELVLTIEAEARRRGVDKGQLDRFAPLHAESGTAAAGAGAKGARATALERRFTWEFPRRGSRGVEICGFGLAGGEAIAVVAAGGRILGVDLRATAADRAPLWERPASSDARDPTPIPLAAGNVLVVAARRELVGLDPRNGETAWQQVLDPPLLTSLSESGLVYVVTDSREGERVCRLSVVEPVTGAVLWRRDLDDRWPTELAADGPLVGIGGRGARSLDVLDGVTGEVLTAGVASSIDPGSVPRLFADLALVITPGRVAGTEGGRPDLAWEALLAYRPEESATPLWEHRAFRGAARHRDLFRHKDALVALYESMADSGALLWVLDPATGSPRRAALQLDRGSELFAMDREMLREGPLLVAKLEPTSSRFGAPPLREPLRVVAIDPARADVELWSRDLELPKCQLVRNLEAVRIGASLAILLNVIPNGENRCQAHLFVLDAATGELVGHDVVSGETTWQKGHLGRAGGLLFILQETRQLVVYQLK
ncbi:MAG: PQQ-binding-like beta-propeller repeat protein [Planctomycetota bacterium]